MRKGSKHTKKAKEKMRIIHLGKSTWNKDLHWNHMQKEKIRLSMAGKRNSIKTEFKKGNIPWNKGKNQSEITKQRIREKRKLQIITKEHIRKSLRRKDMSNLEKKMQGILNIFNLPYKFVGNGKFFIERKCPDFINSNNEKIALEVYDVRHKQYLRGNIEEWKNKRIEIFSKYGWKIEFFDAMQVNEEEILRRLNATMS